MMNRVETFIYNAGVGGFDIKKELEHAIGRCKAVFSNHQLIDNIILELEERRDKVIKFIGTNILIGSNIDNFSKEMRNYIMERDYIQCLIADLMEEKLIEDNQKQINQ